MSRIPRSRVIRTRVFMNGNSQAVRIPREFRLDCEQILISRNEDGDLVLRPQPARELRGDVLLEILAGFDADFVQALEDERWTPRPPQDREAL